MKTQTTKDSWLTTSDVARLAGVAGRTVVYWNDAGKLAAMRTLGGVRLFALADVARFLKQREAAAQRRGGR